MKIKLTIEEFFSIFPQYEAELKQAYEDHINILEKYQYNIEKIKDKNIKNIIELQLGTKEDYGFKVTKKNMNEDNEETFQWEIKVNEKNELHAIILRDNGMVIEWDNALLDGIEVIEYIKEKYNIEVIEYESKNYIGEGIINWETVGKNVEKNWDKSFFFLENMSDEKFVENNKRIILQKTKDNEEIFKKAIMKSEKFFEYAIENMAVEKILSIVKDDENMLANIWNKKVKDIISNTDYEKMFEKEHEQMLKELNQYTELMKENAYRYANYEDNYGYGSFNETDQYLLFTKRLEKELEKREIEIRKKVKENKITVEKIELLLKEDITKNKLIKGLLKSTIYNEDFKYFENDIINDNELKELAISKGLYKTLAPTKKFIESLSNEQLYEFLKVCNKNISGTIWQSEDKRYFASIVSEEKLLSVFRHNKIDMNEMNIVSNIKTKNKELRKYIFKTNPKENFEDLEKNDITEEDIRFYLRNGGYISKVKERYNIYDLKEIETVKIICEQESGFLNNKKVPEEWKINPEVIKALLINNNIKESNLSKDNVIELSKDINFVKDIVSNDRSMHFYELLPDKLKTNINIALNLLKVEQYIEDVIKILPKYVLLNKRFTIEVIKKDSKAIKYINAEIWNDKQFVLTLLSEIEGTRKEEEIRKELPEKIQFFLETYNVKKNIYTFFNNYYLQQKLEEKVMNEEPRERVKRIKI